MRLDWSVYGLELSTPLRISRSVMSRRDAVRVVVSLDDVSGHGEVVTSVYYGLDVSRITEVLRDIAPVLASYDSPESALADLAELRMPPGVRAAVDAALHDLVGLRDGIPVHAAIDSPQWTKVATAYTIGVSEPQAAAHQASALVDRGFSVLKIKLDQDIGAVAAIRSAAPDARILLDPNGAWTAEQAVRLLDGMAYLGIDAVEQPIAPGHLDELAWVSERSPVPVIADEDAATVADVRALAGVVRGVNIKLAKCGGIVSALDIIAAARTGGLDVMLGCLVASSLGIAPAVHLSGVARWVDLDGHLLLARDPFTGIGGEDGTLRLSGMAGLGVVAR